ncbi:hypothetical protein ACLOJK_008647 [Asimina triloba]
MLQKKGCLDLLKKEATNAGSELLLWLIVDTAIVENRVLEVVEFDKEIGEDDGLRMVMAAIHCRSDLKKMEQLITSILSPLVHVDTIGLKNNTYAYGFIKTGEIFKCVFRCSKAGIRDDRGRGLLFDETVDYFKWLFGTWLHAVGGVHPKTIITDQDAVIGATIAEIRHQWILTYTNNIVSAGTRTIGRSESINAFFDGFVNHKSGLIDFANGYGKALERRREAEEHAYF